MENNSSGRESQVNSSSSKGIGPALAKLLKAIAILAILGFFAILFINYWNAGIIQSGISKLGIVVEGTGIASPIKSVGQSLTNLITATNLDETSQSEVEGADPDLGAKITKYEGPQTNKIYFSESINTFAEAKAKNPLADMDITVECSLGDKPRMPAVVSSSFSNKNEAKIIKSDAPEIFTANCLFPEGIASPGEKTRLLAAGSQEVQSVTKQATIYMLFNYETKAIYNAYFMQSEQLAAIQKIGKNPFEYYGIIDPQLTSSRTIISKQTPSPVNVGINTYVSQPLVENRQYTLGISLTSTSDWNGNMVAIDSLYLELPDNIYLESDPEYTQKQIGSQCDFDSTGEASPEKGTKTYRLKASLVDALNNNCRRESKGIASERQCIIDLFSKSRTFRCNFIVSEIPSQGLKYNVISADVKFLYETQKQIPITAVSRPITVV